MAEREKVLIIGAGPAGLTSAYELLSRSNKYDVTIFEESDSFGGISKTVNYKGNRMDMGGHRFFSKVPEVNEWWQKMLPDQGAPSYDDLALGRPPILDENGPNPENEDRVMLLRNRLSRIFFRNKFFDYPISLRWETIKNMGLLTTIKVGFSYLWSLVFKRKEESLEDFYINRFGKTLYSMFFEHYTENLWGRHPSEISPEWGAQRVKGLSISAIIKDILEKVLGRNTKSVETSLIQSFRYPKLGPGQLWEITASEVERMGGRIILNARVCRLTRNGERIISITYERKREFRTESGDYFISSMPIKDLVAAMNDVPERIRKIAEGLPYRDYITVGVLTESMKLENRTDIKTLGNIIPDNWVYVHDRNVKMGRFQVYNNWSPYLVNDINHTVWIGLEYFCNEGDEMWAMPDADFADMAIKEMVAIGIIGSETPVLDFHVERVKKAYPAYFDTYSEMDTLRNWLNSNVNLFCVGRNGQHRYNNIDHSMCTAFETVNNIINGVSSKTNIWNVNTENEYHETTKSRSSQSKIP